MKGIGIKMDTPICDFVKNYSNSGASRFHMPGHKGASFLGYEKMDITEISGADDLYHSHGIIEKSESNATNIFESKATFYSTGGSTQCIKAMLHLALINGNSSTTILAFRNAHKAFVHACALLDLWVEWLIPENNNHLCACEITALELDTALNQISTKPLAVYVTSPNYLGGILDIKALSSVCKKHGVLLLVDNAHGAYLKFLPKSLHPIDLGADMCCDSAHKTLPVLTGGAYLHIAKHMPEEYILGAKQSLSLFGSSSPSYLVLQSLDYCNLLLSCEYSKRLNSTIGEIDKLKQSLCKVGIHTLKSDDLRIVFDAKKSNTEGNSIAKALRIASIEPEYIDDDFVVLMATPYNTALDFQRVLTAFNAYSKIGSLPCANLKLTLPVQKISIRNAFLSKRKSVPVKNAIGHICANSAVSCPPAIPIVISGEEITKETVSLLLHYGINEIEIVV